MSGIRSLSFEDWPDGQQFTQVSASAGEETISQDVFRLDVGTSDTTILSIPSKSGAKLTVFGANTSNENESFVDSVTAAAGASAAAVASNDGGSAADRYYSQSGTDVQLRMGSGTYEVAVLADILSTD